MSAVERAYSNTEQPDTDLMRGELVQAGNDLSPADALASAFQDISRRQLVVLGPPGAGKSTLAILFTLAVLDQDTDEDLVPVLLSVAGWDPAQRIEDWCARRVSEDYPDFGPNGTFNPDQVTALLLKRRIVPVLDGLDEMPRSVLGKALADLDRAADLGLRMVLTCRSAEFEQAVHDRGALAHAAVIDIEPIRVEDTVAYLTEPEVANTRRWSAVIEQMRREPSGPLAHALSTPLMINLARSIYRSPSSTPGELTNFTTKPKITSHLLQKYLPTVLTAGEHNKAQHWLSFLSYHLQEQDRGPNFEWWRLARSVPRWVLVLTIILVSTMCGSILAAFYFLLDPYTPYPIEIEVLAVFTAVGAILGAAAGTLGGLRTISSLEASERPSRHRSRFGVLSETISVIRFLIELLCILGTFVILRAWATGQSSVEDNAVWIATQIAAVRYFDSDTWMDNILAALLIFQAILVINLLGFRAGTPKSITPSIRRLLPSLASGMMLGLVLSTLWFVPGVIIGDLNYTNWNMSPYAFLAIMIGIPIGLVRWLAAPVEEHKAISPAFVLRSDRAALLIAALSSGALIALGFIALTLDERRIVDLTLEDWARSGVVGLAITAVIVLCSGSAWLSYTSARLWLACRGRLPWRLMRFLRTAHGKGVLRQVGPAYQLRHELLRTHLAEQWPSKRRPPPVQRVVPHWINVHRRTRSRVRRWWHSAGILAAVVLLMGTTPVLHLDGHVVLPIGVPVHAVALSPDGTALAASSEDGTVRLWDITAGRPTLTETLPHDGRVASVAFNHDGTTLATGTGTARLWDITTDQPTLTETLFHDGRVASVAFNHDGTTLATGSDDGTARLWDITTDQPTLTETLPHDGRVASVAFNHDGTTLATGSNDSTARLWDITTDQPTLTETLPHDGWVASVAFNHDGTTLATGIGKYNGGYNSTARLWDITTDQPTFTETLNHYGWVLSVAFNHDGTTLATGSNDGTARLWDVRCEVAMADLPQEQRQACHF
ncbi:NACHT and WD40 repeat domain-containing protein [Nocardiopsis sp. NPDC101807]|uniref:NACHT and WD40 repeat domain-containing protein n=1 Tax=Nocardiopsis sp. NPDC101807 TaxID=3364339 RepID=UPI00381732AC